MDEGAGASLVREAALAGRRQLFPRTAINQLEMWQADTFDPATIDQRARLGRGDRHEHHARLPAQPALGAGRPGLQERIDEFLAIAASHHIRPMFVCSTAAGIPTRSPVRSIRRSPACTTRGWVQAPASPRLHDASAISASSRPTSRTSSAAFAKDPRVLAWDVWNEPDNEGGDHYSRGTPSKQKLRRAPAAARCSTGRDAADPTQPLTSGVWIGDDWAEPRSSTPIEKVQLDAVRRDLASTTTAGPKSSTGRVRQLLAYGRPLLCTEYMARGNGSTFDGDLPIAKSYNVAVINWGFVDGKTQTRLPWDSLAAALHARAADDLVPRGLPRGRHALPPGARSTSSAPHRRAQGGGAGTGPAGIRAIGPLPLKQRERRSRDAAEGEEHRLDAT